MAEYAYSTPAPAAPPPPAPPRKAKAPPSRRRSRKAFAPLLEAPPAVLPDNPVYRALTLFRHVPPGCEAHLVHNERFAPHIKAGEFVVIDTTDREPAPGEIFLVKISSPREPEGFVRRLVQLRRDSWTGQDWMFDFSIRRHYGRQLPTDEKVAMLQSGEMTLSDGPLDGRLMRDRIIGRAAGIILPGDAR